MRLKDLGNLCFSAILRQQMRSALTVLGIAVGIAAVVLLTSLGEGLHQYIIGEFTQFGSNIVAINPGKATTLGSPIGHLGTIRPLSLDDNEALSRQAHVAAAVPIVQGNAQIQYAGKTRRTTILGVGPQLPQAFKMRVGSGRFLPEDNPKSPRAFTVLGAKVKTELFGNENPLGKTVRVGGERYRVAGVMESKGQILGFDMDDTLYIPAARALELFNRDSLMEIDILYKQNYHVEEVVSRISTTLINRHGKEDFTITTQDQIMDVMGNILNVITFAVGALGGISLLVGGVGILTIMTIAVSERTNEIGLLRALGANRRQIRLLFLSEAAFLAAMGGITGLALGIGGGQLLQIMIPGLPVHTPFLFVVLAESLAVLVGLIAGVIPAQRAANMNPIEALHTE